MHTPIAAAKDIQKKTVKSGRVDIGSYENHLLMDRTFSSGLKHEKTYVLINVGYYLHGSHPPKPGSPHALTPSGQVDYHTRHFQVLNQEKINKKVLGKT